MNDRWTPGIGDPGVLGWFTVIAYLCAAAVCGVVAWRYRGTDHRRGRLDVLFWGALTAMTLALGINKQLDLQSLLTQVLRDAAHEEGWFEARRTLQAAFIFAVGAAGAMLAGMAWWWLPVLRRNMRVALVGLIFVYTYVLVRAASFHHVDLFINRTIVDVKWNGIMEIGGIAIILLGAVREDRALRARLRSARAR